MELFNNTLHLFNDLIKGIFISVLFVICINVFLKKIDTIQALNILRWLLIISAIAEIIYICISFLNIESTGTYWLMFACNCLLPFVLLSKIGNNKYLLLIISIVINSGWLFELFVTYATSIHRDYAPTGYISYLPVTILTKGIFVGLATLIIGNLMVTVKNKTSILGIISKTQILNKHQNERAFRQDQ
jgi:hypothetical protein